MSTGNHAHFLEAAVGVFQLLGGHVGLALGIHGDGLDLLLLLGPVGAVGLHRRDGVHHVHALDHLTEGGCETIHYFSRNLPPAIKKDIDEYLKEKQFDLKEEASVKADYYTTRTNEYEVRCRIEENGSNLIDLKLTVPTEQEAEAIANRWNAKSQEIYTLLLTKLL